MQTTFSFFIEDFDVPLRWVFHSWNKLEQSIAHSPSRNRGTLPLPQNQYPAAFVRNEGSDKRSGQGTKSFPRQPQRALCRIQTSSISQQKRLPIHIFSVFSAVKESKLLPFMYVKLFSYLCNKLLKNLIQDFATEHQLNTY